MIELATITGYIVLGGFCLCAPTIMITLLWMLEED